MLFVSPVQVVHYFECCLREPNFFSFYFCSVFLSRGLIVYTKVHSLCSLMHAARSTLFVIVVVGAAAVAQVFATQLTSMVFRDPDAKFASPVSLTWFSMHGLLLLALPWVWGRWKGVAPHPSTATMKRRAAAVNDEEDEERRRRFDEDERGRYGESSGSMVGERSMAVLSSYGVGSSTTRLQEEGPAGISGDATTLVATPANLQASAPLLAPSSHQHLQPFEEAFATGHPLLASLRGISRILFLYALYVAANVSYVKALQGLAPALVSAIFCAAPGFVLLLSWPVLGRRIQRVEVASVVLGLGGIVLITQPWDHDPPSTSSSSDSRSNGRGLNALYATVAPAASAVYKVFFAKFYSEVTWAYVGSRLGAISMVNIVVGTLMLTAYLSMNGEPDPVASASIPWKWVVPANAASIAFNFLVNFGVTITFPLFVSVASLASTAANLVLDATLMSDESDGGGGVGTLSIVGLLMVMSSLAVLLISVWRQRKRGTAEQREARMDGVLAAHGEDGGA